MTLASTTPTRFRRADLLGAWRLLSVEMLRPDGEVSYEWLGKRPAGTVIYDASGVMSAQIMRDPRPAFAPGHYCCLPGRTATVEELADGFQGYYAYFGTYELDEVRGIVVHNITASLWPQEVGIRYERSVALVGDSLVLLSSTFEIEGEQRQNRLTWERIKG